MDFSGKHVVITGGTGALGSAVTGLLLAAGARCTVPYRHAEQAQRIAHRDHPHLTLIATGDLADEAAVAKLYDELPAMTSIWASIHIAGGFATGDVADTDKAALMAQIDGNLVSCFLCCRAAVRVMLAAGNGGRIVNVAARPALEQRSGGGMARCSGPASSSMYATMLCPARSASSASSSTSATATSSGSRVTPSAASAA